MSHILIVDDEPTVLNLSKIILEKQNYQVSAFTCPEKALNSLKELDAIDLLITDLIMPKLKGDKLVQEVQKVYRDINSIIISASHDLQDLDLLAMTNTCVLSKPFHFPDLIKLVEEKL